MEILLSKKSLYAMRICIIYSHLIWLLNFCGLKTSNFYVEITCISSRRCHSKYSLYSFTHSWFKYSNRYSAILHVTFYAFHYVFLVQIFSEIREVQQRTYKQDLYDVQKMHFLLATVYESARLLPPGPLLQRCSLDKGRFLTSSALSLLGKSLHIIPK